MLTSFSEYQSKHLHVMTISTSYVESEVDRAGKTIMPFVGVGLTVMMICSVVTVALSALYMQQFSLYKVCVPSSQNQLLAAFSSH